MVKVMRWPSRPGRVLVAGLMLFDLMVVMAKPGGMNVLLITVDDLRPEIGAFHPWSPNDTIITPNLDSLVANGTLFANAVVQFALCAPSRTSFLTSLSPDTTQIYSIGPFFRNTTERGRTAVTLPQAFKNAGFHTESYGKIFHVSDACYHQPIVTGGHKGCLNDPISWSVLAWLPDPYEERGFNTTKTGPAGPMNPQDLSWVTFDADDEAFPDGNISLHAVRALHRIKRDIVNQGENFFLGVGFLKPHLPHVFPKQYLEMYANVHAPQLASNPFAPTNSPRVAWGGVMQEISEYADIVSARHGNRSAAPFDLPLKVQVNQKRAYHVATTYIDAQIGKVLNALEELSLQNSTIIAVIGDHGWKLGEHGGWAKKTNFWNDAHGLLIVSDPRRRRGARVTTTAVEYLDLYPTLADLALPSGVPPGLEGTSFAQLLDDPTQTHRNFGFYQYTCYGVANCMGYSVLSMALGMRYTQWVRHEHGVPDFDKHMAPPELYVHHTDPHENDNVAADPAYADDCAALSHKLKHNFGHTTARGMSEMITIKSGT